MIVSFKVRLSHNRKLLNLYCKPIWLKTKWTSGTYTLSNFLEWNCKTYQLDYLQLKIRKILFISENLTTMTNWLPRITINMFLLFKSCKKNHFSFFWFIDYYQYLWLLFILKQILNFYLCKPYNWRYKIKSFKKWD